MLTNVIVVALIILGIVLWNKNRKTTHSPAVDNSNAGNGGGQGPAVDGPTIENGGGKGEA